MKPAPLAATIVPGGTSSFVVAQGLPDPGRSSSCPRGRQRESFKDRADRSDSQRNPDAGSWGGRRVHRRRVHGDTYRWAAAKRNEINVTGGFNWTMKKDTLAMPVAVGYKHQSMSTVGTGVATGMSGRWLDRAASLTVDTKVTKDSGVGLIDEYDAGGLIGKDVPSEQHAMDSTYLTLVVVFYDADGRPLG